MNMETDSKDSVSLVYEEFSLAYHRKGVHFAVMIRPYVELTMQSILARTKWMNAATTAIYTMMNELEDFKYLNLNLLTLGNKTLIDVRSTDNIRAVIIDMHQDAVIHEFEHIYSQSCDPPQYRINISDIVRIISDYAIITDQTKFIEYHAAIPVLNGLKPAL